MLEGAKDLDWLVRGEEKGRGSERMPCRYLRMNFSGRGNFRCLCLESGRVPGKF